MLAMPLSALYTVYTGSIQVNNEVSIYGLLKLDSESKLYFMDKPIAFFKNEIAKGISDFGFHLKCNLVFQTFFLGLSVWALSYSSKGLAWAAEELFSLQNQKQDLESTIFLRNLQKQQTKEENINSPPFVNQVPPHLN